MVRILLLGNVSRQQMSHLKEPEYFTFKIMYFFFFIKKSNIYAFVFVNFWVSQLAEHL